MTLEEDEQALSLLRKGVDSRILRSCEHAIAAGHQSVLRYFVPPGVRHLQSSRNGGRQRMVCYSLAIEDAATLVAEPATADTVNVQYSRVRCQAGPDSRMSVALGPVHQCGQASPVWLVHEVWRPRLCPRYDEAVEMAVPEIIDIGIEAAHTALA